MKKTMKSVLRSFVACLLAVLMVVPVMATEATTESELPNAEVKELGATIVGPNGIGDVFTTESYYEYDLIGQTGLSTKTEDFELQVTMQFIAKDEAGENETYGGYYTDFYIQIDGMSDVSITGDEDCYLAGYYPSFESWVKIPLANFPIENGKVYPVITSAGFGFTYDDICESVQNFICGIHLSEEILKANPNLEVTLELGLSENLEAAQAADFVTVDGYTYDTTDLLGDALPNAEVINLGSLTLTKDQYTIWGGGNNTSAANTDMNLQIVMQFLAKDTKEQADAGIWGKYITDFYITIDGMSGESIEADENCYLAGNYGTFGWIMIPLNGTTVENGKTYPIVTNYDAKLTYSEICGNVKDFICGIHLSDAILEKNPNLKVTLELGLSETAGADFIRVGDAYTYTADELAGEFAKITSANVTLGETLTMNYKVVLGKAYTGATMNFYRDGELSVENVAGVATDDGAYIYSFEGITPQCIGDNIKAELCFDGEVIAEKDDYSVKQNLLNIKNKTTSDKLVTLIDNTLVYGAAAQTYRNYKTDALVTADLQDLVNTKTTPEKTDRILYKSTMGGVYFTSATVWFSNVNSLAFKYLDKTNTAKVFVTVNNGEVKEYTPVLENDVYVIQTSGITALQMDDIYKVKLVVDGETVQTLTYSVNSYIYSKANGADGAMKELAIALYNYGIAAEAYARQFLSYTISVENGTMADGTTSAVCTPDAELMLKANTPETGYIFSHWENSAKEVVGTETTLTVTVIDDETYTAVMVQNLTYRLDGGVYIVSRSDDWTGTDLVIPAMYKGVPVTSINQNGFKGVALTSVYVPEGVTYIGSYAFDWIKDIKWVHIPSTLTMADNGVFPNAIGIVYYGGTEENWANINIRTLNSGLTDAPRYYYSETQPTEDGNFWHYVDGVPTAW